MFYVFHSGEAAIDNERVTVIGPEQLADLGMDVGWVGWLIRRCPDSIRTNQSQIPC